MSGFERYKQILKISYYYYLIKEFELTNTINNLLEKHFLKKNEPQVTLSCYQKPADNITVLSNVCKPS